MFVLYSKVAWVGFIVQTMRKFGHKIVLQSTVCDYCSPDCNDIPEKIRFYIRLQILMINSGLYSITK